MILNVSLNTYYPVMMFRQHFLMLDVVKMHSYRSKGAKWHLLGFFGLSLYWHPQKVLQRTLLGGSLERTLLRTLI